MKITLILLMLSISISSFANCSISHQNFDLRASRIEKILETKGYQITNNDPDYKLHAANYHTPNDYGVTVVNLFERGNNKRIAYVEESFSVVGTITGKIERTQKSFLKNLPECK